MLVDGTIKEQVIQLSQLAWVTSATQLMIALPALVAVPIAGHIDNQSMDAVGLGFSIINLCSYGILVGLATASETLFSQFNGSSNKSGLVFVAQRGLVIQLLASVLICSVLLHTETFLILCGQERTLASMTHRYILTTLPGQPIGLAVLLTLLKYLQAQKIVKPCLLTGLLANILYIGYMAGLVFGLKLGVIGCGVSVSLTIWSWNLLLLAYIRSSKVYTETGSGFTFECLVDWSTFLKYGVSGVAMITIEMLCFEVYTLLAGLLGPLQLSVHLILNCVAVVSYHISYGFSSAATIQIGNYLGAGEPDKARTAARVCIAIGLCFTLLVPFIVLGTHTYLPYIFTSDPDVITVAQSTLLILCVEQIGEFMNIESGILRAQGKQFFGAISNMFCLGFLTIPLAVYLIFWTPLKVGGAWVALTCGCMIQIIIFSLNIYFTDWDQEAERAQKNAGVKEDITEHIIYKEEIISDQNENTCLTKKKPYFVSRNTIILRSVQILACIFICIISGVTRYFIK